MAPHEKAQEQSARALDKIQARRPVTLSRFQVQTGPGNDIVRCGPGFDVIYSLQDLAFDRKAGLHSIPVRFGIAGALRFSSVFHACTVVFLAAVGISAQTGFIYWIGFAIVAVILFWEHRLVTPTDLSRINRAFFDFNAYVSIGYLLTTVADLLLINGPGTGR